MTDSIYDDINDEAYLHFCISKGHWLHDNSTLDNLALNISSQCNFNV